MTRYAGPSARSSRARGRGVDPDWLVRQYRDTSNGSARNMLELAILKHVDRERAIALMREVFDTLPPSSAHALGRLGGEAELAFLRAKQAEHAPRTLARKEVDKAVAAIERRLARGSGGPRRTPKRVRGAAAHAAAPAPLAGATPHPPTSPNTMSSASGSPLEIAYLAVEAEVAPLVGALLDFARTQVQRRGAFLPFGGVVTATGEMDVMMAGPGEGRAATRAPELLPELHEALRSHAAEREIRIVAVVEDVRIRMPGQRESAAIKVLVEHRDGHCFALYQRHRRRLLFGVRFEDVAVHDADPEVRAWDPVDRAGDTR